MILPALSLLDLFVSALLIAHYLGFSTTMLLVYAASYLLLKASFFFNEWMSWVDAAVGVWLLLLALGMHSTLSLVAAGWLVYKGVYGLLVSL